MDLAQLQTTFQNYLLHNQETIQSSIISTDKVSKNTRLDIYKNAYFSRLLEVLQSNYPCLHLYLGDEAFQNLGHGYIHQYPSHYRSIRWFGDAFVNYLLAEPFPPHLAEFAEFEWKMTLAFDADDAPVFTLEQMASIAPESWGDMRLIPHPSVQTMTFHWNTVALWEQVQQKIDPATAQKSAPIAWVLWRVHYRNKYYALSLEESVALNSAIQGSSFGEICETLCQWTPENEVGLQAAGFLKGWIQSGLLSDIQC
ncbi:MAG: DNA-binding domain-containing protein [Silvanigrellaceae bacterium]|nr:DNA-binding domain-containing protein [Silvanigrellaceae bacterium]